MATTNRKLPILLVGFLLGGCSAPTGPERTYVCWVNFVQVGGTRYVDFGQLGRVLEEADLGTEVARVKFKLDGNVYDPNYRSCDGDAAFLEEGTPLHAVRGYHPSFRLAARTNSRIYLFEADRAPAAQRGADLLDLDGKVAAIHVREEGTAEPRWSTITNPERVAALVASALQAPIEPAARPESEPSHTLVFQLKDGTGVQRRYWSNARLLLPAIRVPAEFDTWLRETAASAPSAGEAPVLVRQPSVCRLE